MNKPIRISHFLSFFFRNVFSYILVGVSTAYLIYYRYYNKELAMEYFFWLSTVLGVLQWVLLQKLTTYVYFDREHQCLVAFNKEDGERNVYPLQNLWRVRRFRWYTLLTFSDNRRLFYLAGASFPILGEGGESYIPSLRKRAKSNRRKARETTA
jgi:hypothetical protein